MPCHARTYRIMYNTCDEVVTGLFLHPLRPQVWDLATLQKIQTLSGHTDAVRALAVAGGRLFSGSYDSTVRVWDENTLQCLDVLKGHNGPVRTLVHCRNQMFSGSYDRTVKVGLRRGRRRRRGRGRGRRRGLGLGLGLGLRPRAGGGVVNTSPN